MAHFRDKGDIQFGNEGCRKVQARMDTILLNSPMKSYDFTIVTPVYNGSAWIEETIESVLKVCAGFRYQYIVVDDGSTDETPELLQKYRDFLEIETQLNQGEATAVNTGLQLGKGTYAIIVSADDPMRSPNLLIAAKKLLDEDVSLVCVYPDWSVIDAKSRIQRDLTVPEFDLQILLGEANCVAGPGSVFRLDKALQIGGRRSKYKFTSDYDFWLRLSQVGRFRRIPGFLAFWREHENSTSVAQRGLEMAQEKIAVTKDFIEENQSIPRKMKRMATGFSYYHAAGLMLSDRKVPGKRWLIKSLLNFPSGFWRFDRKVMLFIMLDPVLPYMIFIRNRLRSIMKSS